jgi:hypothetical protein
LAVVLAVLPIDSRHAGILAKRCGNCNYLTFDAAGNQQIESGPSGMTTNVWDYENQRTGVLLPSGERETMVYNANFRNVRTES